MHAEYKCILCETHYLGIPIKFDILNEYSYILFPVTETTGLCCYCRFNIISAISQLPDNGTDFIYKKNNLVITFKKKDTNWTYI